MKIDTILGARPQFIKASVVSDALRSRPEVRERVIHTGQHYDENMSAVFFDELGMNPPDVNLAINGGSHGQMTGRMLEGIEKVFLEDRPDIVMVYGDTNSTLAGALAAAKLDIPVAHVEAGLRSFNRQMPEELNRVLTDHLSAWLFAPTTTAVENLHREGIAPETIYEVGDVMYDVALHHGRRAAERAGSIIDRLALRDRPYVLATIHRQENTDAPERLRLIVDALRAIAREMPVVWPVHPRTRQLLRDRGMLSDVQGLSLIDAQSYLNMVSLERAAAVIATDSGGVQKEAFFHRVPCVTLRAETEWVELVELGWNQVVPPESAAIVRDAVLGAVGRLGRDGSPYGDGDAATRVVDRLTASQPAATAR